MIDTNAITNQARKLYGKDIVIMVARAVAFGDTVNMVIVLGRRHVEAAKGFAMVKGAKFETVISRKFPCNTEYTYTTVTF